MVLIRSKRWDNACAYQEPPLVSSSDMMAHTQMKHSSPLMTVDGNLWITMNYHEVKTQHFRWTPLSVINLYKSIRIKNPKCRDMYRCSWTFTVAKFDWEILITKSPSCFVRTKPRTLVGNYKGYCSYLCS